MLDRIKNWFKEHKLPIIQGIWLVAICLVILACCNGCGTFSSPDSAVRYGLVNNDISITGGETE